MQLASHLMMVAMVVAACSAAMIPNMMFAGLGRHNPHHPQFQQQAQHWRPTNLSPWDDGTETYGYLADRHPNVIDDLSAGGFQQPQLQQQQPLVYGVPHRFLSEPNYPTAPNPAEELYNNALLLRGRTPFKRSSFSPFYEAGQLDDYMADEAETPEDYYDRSVSRQDVINFEKYVQRFFQQQQQPMVSDEDVSDGPLVDDWSSMTADTELDNAENEMATNYDVDNDEEAARQLHLLLNQQRKPITAMREIQKKSSGPATTTVSPGTESQVTTATTTKTSSVTLLPHQQHHQGQKEEPLLRPPTPQRQQPQQQAVSTPSPAAKEDNSIYHTIQRLMNMRDELQQVLSKPFD